MRLPLFFFLAMAIQVASAAGEHANTSRMRVSNNDRVNEANRDIEAAIRNSRSRHKWDRKILYTGHEEIFKKIGDEKNFDDRSPYGTGDQFMYRAMEFSSGQCIPNLTVLSHGWGASRTSGGLGLPIAENSGSGYPVTGLYLNEEARVAELYRSVDDYIAANREAIAAEFRRKYRSEPTEADWKATRDSVAADYNAISVENSVLLYADNHYKVRDKNTGKLRSGVTPSLATRIRKGEIKFCNSCLIELYSCNIHKTWVTEFSKITGCQVIYGTGKVTGFIRDGKTVLRGNRASDEILDAQGKGTGRFKNINKRDGDFVRVTPLKDSSGKVLSVVEENIGQVVKTNKDGEKTFEYTLYK